MDTDVTTRALSREWPTGLIVIAGGFVIAIAVAAWLTLTHKPAPVAGQVGQPGAAATGQASGTDPTQVCRTALANAQNFGVLPAYGTLADANPKETSVQGRYTCAAATPSAKYALTVDLVCEQLDNAQCVALYSVTQDDGSVLYHRQGQ
ncbi:MAG: hypothetical protein J0H30_00540 [Alphaproteobacteria bacterium]|nr:hypothetical protein [Alphaproteobacteria bacterium]